MSLLTATAALSGQGRGPADLANAPVPPGARRIAYGSDPLQFGELRLPSGVERPPVAIVVHGGYWAATLGKYDPRAVAIDNMRPMAAAAFSVMLWSGILAGSQTESTAALSKTLRAHLSEERFGIVTSIRGLPIGVRGELQKLFGGATLDIAEPGAEFQATDVIVKPNLPIRRLVAAGCARDNHCLVYYERGGFAHTWHVALFHWTPDATRFEWGGSAPGSLGTIEDVRKAILSGAIKGANRGW